MTANGRGPKRGGFRAIPYAMEIELRELPVSQRSVLTSLAFEAQHGAPAVLDVDGVSITLDVGEALVSIRGLAATLQLGEGSKGESLVRRSLASGRRIGLISTRPARPTGDVPPDGRGDRPPGGPRDAPATIVRFLRHRDFLWPVAKGDAPLDAPRDVPRDARGDAIPVVQEIQKEHQRQRPRARGDWPATSELADALTARWNGEDVVVVPPGPDHPRDAIEAAIRELGLEVATEICHVDAVSAVRSGRVKTIPTSIGFFGDKLIRAAALRGGRAPREVAAS